MKPQVSVIILNYNTYQFTYNCIQSIVEKTKGVSYEIIVVDNASPTEDPSGLKEAFPSINLLLSKENLGFAKGNNWGIQHANAEYYLLLNNDTLLINDAITIAYKKFIEHSQVGVVGAQLQFPDGTYQHSAQKFPAIKYQLIELFRLQKLFSAKKRGRFFLGGYFSCEEDVFADWIWGTFFMIKKEVVEKFKDKKLPDDFFMYGEDFQWGIEIKKIGYKILFTADPKIIHFAGQSSNDYSAVSLNYFKVIEKYKGTFYLSLYKLIFRLLKLTTRN